MALNAASDEDGLDVFCEVCRSRSSCRKTWDLFGAFLLNRGGASRGLSQETSETDRDYTSRNSCHCRVQMHGLLLRAAESSKHSAGHFNCDMPTGELQAQSEGELDPSFPRKRESSPASDTRGRSTLSLHLEGKRSVNGGTVLELHETPERPQAS